MKIPKDFKDKKELKRIIKTVELLNKELEQIHIYRGYKPRGCKTPTSVDKKWLKLVFAEVTRSVSKGEPLPREIRIKGEE